MENVFDIYLFFANMFTWFIAFNINDSILYQKSYYVKNQSIIHTGNSNSYV